MAQRYLKKEKSYFLISRKRKTYLIVLKMFLVLKSLLGVLQYLKNTFKNLEKHLKYFLEKHLKSVLLKKNT